jgi:methanogenic corrinoid protein MtbC1
MGRHRLAKDDWMPADGSSSAVELIDRLLHASVSHDASGVRRELDAGVQSLGLGACLDEVLFPALQRIGGSWQRGDLDIPTERLATETARGWLEELTLSAPRPAAGAPLILTCGPADLHSIGLEALAVLLRHQGQSCRLLGPRTPVHTLRIAIMANQPVGVVVISHLPRNWLSATQSLRAAAELGPAVFYGGAAFSAARQRRDVPGTHLDTDLRGACARLTSLSGGNRD